MCLIQSVSLTSKCKVSFENQSTLTAARPVVVYCLCQFPATLLVSLHSFVCGTDHISYFSIMLRKTMQKTDFLFSFLLPHSHDDSFEPVPFASSEPVDNRLPTEEGKQTKSCIRVPALKPKTKTLYENKISRLLTDT